MKKNTYCIAVLIVLALIGCASMYTASVGENSHVTFVVMSDGPRVPYPSNSSGYYAIITGYNGTATDIQIPSEVKFGINVMPVSLIEARAFEGKGLRSVIIPDGVVSIGERAFANNQLTSVRFPANIRTIGANAFAGNPSLTNIPMTAQQRQQAEQQRQQTERQRQQTERQAQLAEQGAAEEAEYNRIVGLYRNAGQSFGNLPGTTWRGLYDGSIATLQFHAGGVFQLNVMRESIAGTYRVSGNTVIIRQETTRWLTEYISGVIRGNSLHVASDLIFHRQ
jgi:hypothetical protein